MAETYLVEPPAYPRIPHLAGSARSRDDLLLRGWPAWMANTVTVEEKVDGANVALWLTAPHRIGVASRGGVDAQDRGRQLGRLRAWTAERHDALCRHLLPGQVLYGEWLWRAHAIEYDCLPDLFIGLDLYVGGAFASVARRDAWLAEAGLCGPPPIFRGPIADLAQLQGLCGQARWGPGRAEGLVIRHDGPDRRLHIVKWVRPDFVRAPDALLARHDRWNQVAS